MKTGDTGNPQTQFSRRMITIYADLLNKRSLASIICIAFLIVVLVYLATAFVRKIYKFQMYSSVQCQLKIVQTTMLISKVIFD